MGVPGFTIPNCVPCGVLLKGGSGWKRNGLDYCDSCYQKLIVVVKDERLTIAKTSEDVEQLSDGKPFDIVTKPKHYHAHEMDTLTFLEKGFDSSVVKGFCIGNAIKYIQRFEHKNGTQDLEKAKEYLEKLIEYNKKDLFS